LASKRLTLRQKKRILAARQPPDSLPSNRTFLLAELANFILILDD
jgi:hypothetical protein